MSFDFFNTSNLAFGNKLTTAFKQLFNNLQQAEDNITNVLERQSIYNDFVFKNYIVGNPSAPTSPCRSNEILNIVKHADISSPVKLECIGDNENASDILTINLNIYDTSSNIVTNILGSTNITADDWNINDTLSNRKSIYYRGVFIEKYVYFTLADSNMNMIVTPEFTNEKKKTEDLKEGQEFLCKIRINPRGQYSLCSVNKRFNFSIGDFGHYKELAITDLTTQNSQAYFEVLETKKFPTWGTLPTKVKAKNKFIINLQSAFFGVIKINGVVRYDFGDLDWVSPNLFIPVNKNDIIEFNSRDNRAAVVYPSEVKIIEYLE